MNSPYFSRFGKRCGIERKYGAVVGGLAGDYMTVMADETSPKIYASPPIVEALIEVRLAADVNENRLKKAFDWLSGRYQERKAEAQIEAKVEVPLRRATFTDKPAVYTLSSSDQTDACHLRVGSIAWLRRAPYLGWEAFRDRCEAELATVLKAYGDPRIARIGLRYINRIDVKIAEDGLSRYEDYLNFKISHGDLLEPTNGFQWLLVKQFPEVQLQAMVQSASLEPEIPGYGAFLFDIDVSREMDVPQKAENILEQLEAMRVLKNSIFEAGITDLARESYK